MDETKKQRLREAGINVTKALGSFMQMEPMFEKFLDKFCGDPSFSLLQKAIQEKDQETAHRAAHTLKGVSGTLGMDNLYALLLKQDNFFKAHEWETGYDMMPEVAAEYDKMIAAIKG